MDIKILVATHKNYWMPEDVVYLPLHVGREGKNDLGYVGDNTGDNISTKNSMYCELTGMYWAWKNLKCDYIGLCHYRRYFCFPSVSGNPDSRKENVFQKEKYEQLLKNNDIILPFKSKVSKKTVKEQYCASHYGRDLEVTRDVVGELYPEYIDSFDSFMSNRKMFFFNMFVMNKKLFDEYCTWLFAILFEVEKRTDISNYDTYQSRVYGFLSERLFNVWVAHKKLKAAYAMVENIEETNNHIYLHRLIRNLKYRVIEKLEELI
ncbi:DUF4422 domain-containing protein [Phascolarctobacterium sp.]|uniref:DUF4422 domain-containing protein n=1 Tax=Phascolarctobacterium sp. TaxID=2049039 RepID=UPI00386AE55A